MRIINEFDRMKQKNGSLLMAVLMCVGLSSCSTNSVNDIDGNKYKTITINKQVWMAEDLKTTRYNDSSVIPLVSDYEAWSKLNSGGFCWYNNDSTNKKVYGALYNWYAVATNKLCPKGWHVPSDDEWMSLQTFSGGAQFAGGKLKEKGISNWKSPNTGATNSFGFTALPAGFRSFKGSFSFIGKSAYWWTSTEDFKTNANFYSIRYKYSNLYQYIADKPNGFCVRCLLNK
jgi:uncharacterized protein (TIGR02145 family)